MLKTYKLSISLSAELEKLNTQIFIFVKDCLKQKVSKDCLYYKSKFAHLVMHTRNISKASIIIVFGMLKIP